MERTPIQALRVGMTVPILEFSGQRSFDNLTAPKGYYVVIAEHPDGSTRLALGFAGTGTCLPQVLILERREIPFTVLALSDTAIRGGLVPAHILESLRRIHSPLIAPDTPLRAGIPEGNTGGAGYGMGRDIAIKAAKAFAPLRRALHHDTTKFQKLTQHMADLKLTDPSLGVNTVSYTHLTLPTNREV